jgi:drug/metabolite transporter (DMT)-like permease
MLISGTSAMLLAAFLFSLMNVCVKYISHLPVLEIVFFRSLISLILTLFYLRLKKIRIQGSNYTWLVVRGLAGCGSLLLHFITLQSVYLASAVTLQFLAPIFSALLAVVLLKEKLQKMDLLFFALSFGGVVVLSGFDASMDWQTALIGVTSSLLAGLAYNSIRKIKDSEHPLIVVLFFPLVALPITGVYCFFHFVAPSFTDWLFLLAIGLVAQAAQYFTTLAYQKEKVAHVAILRYTGILYALFLGFFLFSEKFNYQSYLGMALVIAGVVGSSLYKKYYEK